MQKSSTPEYRAWYAMLARCTKPQNPEFHNYGGRGITVCNRWKSFDAFLEDMGPRPSTKHTLDRVDNERGYEPDNCAWRTQRQQMNNIRKNRWISYRGHRKTIAQWARLLSMDPGTLHNRLSQDWSVEDAFFKRLLRSAPPKVKLRSHPPYVTCMYGHPFDETNTVMRGDKRECRICSKRRAKESAVRRTLRRKLDQALRGEEERLARLQARRALQTHCAHGHPWSEENTIWESGRNVRRCKICTRATKRSYEERHKGRR